MPYFFVSSRYYGVLGARNGRICYQIVIRIFTSITIDSFQMHWIIALNGFWHRLHIHLTYNVVAELKTV